MNQKFWYNGNLIEGDTLELNISDPAFIYGATVFTTLRVYNKSLSHPLTQWEAHCLRLQISLETFEWQFPNRQSLQTGATSLLPYFPVLRITIFPDGRELITSRSLPANLTQRQEEGIAATLAPNKLQRSLPGQKTGNYLGAYLALQQAQKFGASEAILVDHQGNFLETSTGNLWGYKNPYWYTPSLATGILPGISRQLCLSKLNAAKENIWTPDFIKNLEAIAYTNCAVEVIPIHTIILPETQLKFNPKHPALNQLRACFFVS
ncbi:MAG: aminotransferase class IV [Gomphosphaeria aponina SAG 52.96 = DSM 107014]|uniref:Aminotransferase class IV n=1 Tax=Gomphosphaeria aponina SAG 52.96 = DSM 107014 TaxID=1521640 RepID=A0A941GSI0_9CHRO|nr:aminotransferase class IV [Gomphosphaeria aponina SAG 52.96 = DSM 107014]